MRHLVHPRLTHYSALQHALVWLLARSPARSESVGSASFCVVAAPGRDCGWRDENASLGNWSKLCPDGKRLVVIDASDADSDRPIVVCESLWSSCKAAARADADAAGRLLRVTGSAPRLHVRWGRSCPPSEFGTLSVPYMAHA